MRLPGWIVPLLIVLATVAGLSASQLFSIPSLTVDYPVPAEASVKATQVTKLIVHGIKCVTTAKGAANTLRSLPGIIKLEAYGSYNRVEIVFDPDQTSISDIQEAIEGPIFDEKTQHILFNQFKVVEIDSEKVSIDK